MKSLIIATLLVLSLHLSATEYQRAEQFKVWGSVLPESVTTIKIPVSLNEVKPGNHNEFKPEDNGAAKLYPYSLNAIDHMHYLRVPGAAELISPRMKAFISWDEYEPLVLGVYASETLNLKLKLSTLKNKKGEVFPVNNLDLRIVRQIPYPNSKGSWRMEPLILEKKDSVMIPTRQSAYVWLTAYAPEGLPGGLYSGTLKLSADNTAEKDIPVSLRVLPFRLADAGGLFSMLYGESMKGQIRGDSAKMKEEFIDMRQHGMNHLAYMQNRPKYVENPDGSFTFDFDKPAHSDNKAITEIMNLALQTGLNKAYFPHYHGVEKYSPYTWGTEKCDRYYTELFLAWKRNATLHNWPEIIQNICDEPHGKWMKVSKHLAGLTKRGKEKIKSSGFTSGEFFGYDETTELPELDIYIVGGGDRSKLKHFLNAGKKYVLYNRAKPHDPRSGRRLGWLIYDSGAIGYQQFMYRIASDSYYPLSPRYVPQNNENTVWIYSYSGKDGLLPTPSFEMIREGIDDLRYINTLKELAGRALRSDDEKTRMSGEDAVKLLEELKNKLSTYSSDGKFKGEALLEEYPSNSYDMARYHIAVMILKLHRILGEESGNDAPIEAKPNPQTQQLSISYDKVGKSNWLNKVREYVSGEVEKAPVIDGKLDDKCWDTVAESGSFYVLSSDAISEFSTTFKCLYDHNAIYLGMTMKDSRSMHQLSGWNKDRPIWKSNTVEVFIMPSANSDVFTHLAIDFHGRKVALGGIRKNGKLFQTDELNCNQFLSAISGSMNTWTVELQIPFKSIGMDPPEQGMACKLQLGRTKPYGEPGQLKEEFSSWAKVINRFAEADKFGTLFFGRKSALTIEQAVMAELSPDVYICIADIRNHLSRNLRYAWSEDVTTMRELPPGVSRCYIPVSKDRKDDTGKLNVFFSDGTTQSLGIWRFYRQRPSVLQMPGINAINNAESYKETISFNFLQFPKEVLEGSPINVRFHLPLEAEVLKKMTLDFCLSSDGRSVFRQNLKLLVNRGNIGLQLALCPGIYSLQLSCQGYFSTESSFTVVANELNL